MTIEPKTSIDKAEFCEFMKSFNEGEIEDKRLGQAFFDHFSLYNMNNNYLADAICNADDDTAKTLIKENFNFD